MTLTKIHTTIKVIITLYINSCY